MPTIVVTDLTHFTTPNCVCLAGIDVNSGECLRPLPYLSPEVCANANIQPGVTIELVGRLAGAALPHCEDYAYARYTVHNYSADSFRQVLTNSLSNSIEAGFDVGQIEGKCISIETPPAKSIITISVSHNNVHVIEDGYRDRVRFHVTDEAETEYRFLPCAQLEWYNAAAANKAQAANDLNEYIERHERVFMRIGISRPYQATGRNGYWLQVNGIYGF